MWYPYVPRNYIIQATCHHPVNGLVATIALMHGCHHRSKMYRFTESVDLDLIPSLSRIVCHSERSEESRAL